MKNFFKKVTNLFEQRANTTQSAQFFKKVDAIPTNSVQGAQGEVIDRISQLNRVIIKHEQEIIMSRIRQTVMSAQMGCQVSPQLQNACEIVHYALLNNIPVLIKHVTLIHPDYKISPEEIVDEKQYEQGDNNRETNPDEIVIESHMNKDHTGYYADRRQEWKQHRGR